MRGKLNYQYFTKTGTVDGKGENKNTRYDIYQCKYPSMVLRSKDGKDLAAVSFKYNVSHDDSARSSLPRPVQIGTDEKGRKRYQVLFDHDNKAFSIVITNLCDQYIKFDFLQKDVYIKETDPPENLNQVNEVQGHQSYEITADQNNESRQIMIKKKITSTHTIGVTLEEEEKKTSEEKVGDYLYLHVSPKIGSSICDLFKDAVWFNTYFVALQKQIPKIVENNYLCSHIPQMTRGIPIEEDYESEESAGGGGYGWDDDDYDDYLLCAGPTVLAKKTSMDRAVPQCAAVPEAVFSTKHTNGDISDSDYDDESSDSEVVNEAVLSSTLVPSSESGTVTQSYVGKITGGDKLNVRSYFTGVNYDYTLNSEVVVLGFSVVETNDFDFTTTGDYVEYTFYKDLLLDNKLMDIPIYKNDTCCYCMTDKPTNIFYPCGHEAFCSDCVGEFKKKQVETKNKVECPLCRVNVCFSFKL